MVISEKKILGGGVQDPELACLGTWEPLEFFFSFFSPFLLISVDLLWGGKVDYKDSHVFFLAFCHVFYIHKNCFGGGMRLVKGAMQEG